MKNKRFFGVIFRLLAIILLLAPLAALTYLNQETWFYSDDAVKKLSVGFIITLMFALMLLKGAFKNLDKRLVGLITLSVFTFVVWMFDSIINDLIWILLCSIIGYVSYLIFDTIGIRLIEVGKEYQHEKIRIKARNDYEKNEVKGIGRA